MSYLDSAVISKARSGDRDAIVAVCKYIALCQSEKITPDPGALDFLQDVLKKIGSGQPPDTAFGWKQARKGRRNQNSAYQQWDVKMTVQEGMKRGKSWRKACADVSSEQNGVFLLSQKTIESICKGLTINDELEMSESFFPLPDDYNSHRRKP
jgi:hypothetical protein